MNLPKAALVIPLAGILAAGAAGAVLATAGTSPAGTTQAVAPAAASPTPAPPDASPGVRPEDAALRAALDTLVANGTITSEQRTKIEAAVIAERQAQRAERKAERQAAAATRKADRKLIKEALADGAVTQEELDKLSPSNPLRTAAGLMADGKITKDEIKALSRDLLGGKGGRRGQGGASGAAPAVTPAPSSGTGR